VWSAGGVVVASLALMLVQPLLIEPLFNTYKPALPGPMRAEIVAMAKQVGVPSDKILILRRLQAVQPLLRQCRRPYGTARIAMSDVMFRRTGRPPRSCAPSSDTKMGHYVRGTS